MMNERLQSTNLALYSLLVSPIDNNRVLSICLTSVDAYRKCDSIYVGDFDILVSQVCQLNILIFHGQG